MNSSHQMAWLYQGSRFLCTPLEAMYSLLIFIAIKELDVSLFQLTLLASSKPISSLLAFHCSASMAGRPQVFKKYLIAVNMVAALPALAFPFVDNSWFYVAAHFIFMIGQRAAFPVWNVMLNAQTSKQFLSSLQAKAISIQQSIMIFFPLLIGYWIDGDEGIWRILFLLLALLQLANSLMLMLLPVTTSVLASPASKVSLMQPMAYWRDSLKLLQEDRAFCQYLLLFFWGGAGLVLMQSSLPLFFKESLHLSYTNLTLAFSVCKGIALVSSAKIWSRWINHISLYRLNFYVNIFSSLFIAFILFSNLQTYSIFIAYFMYGAMQAGCELSWNMNGPLFSKKKDCTLYSSLNLLLVGVRGLIFPFCGQLLLFLTGVNEVFFCAAILTFASVVYAYRLEMKLQQTPIADEIMNIAKFSS